MPSILAALGFAFVASFTPGPNNAMLMVSGANWGLWRSVPHILGVSLGFPVMIFALGLGVGRLFETYPLVHDVLKYVLFAYMLYLAWRIARAGRQTASGEREQRPMSFLAAAAFQWVNPKAWVIAIGALALYVSPQEPVLLGALRLALLFTLATLPSCVVWCFFGTRIAGFLNTDRRIAIFNGTMAVLLVASMVPTLF